MTPLNMGPHHWRTPNPSLAAAGAFVVSLDSMMNIAFPAIAAAFAVPPESMRWVIICYTGVYAITAFAGGAIADLVGHGLTFLARTLGLVTGVAVLAALFAARRDAVGFDAAFGDAFLVATLFVALATGLALAGSRRAP